MAALFFAAPVLARQDWGEKLKQAEASEKPDPFAFFRLGEELAAAPGREGIEALKAAWPTIKNAALKQQAVKAWHFESPAPYRRRMHPYVFELFQIVFEANDAGVVPWVANYVPSYAWRTFDSIDGAKAWVAAHKGESSETATIACMKEWVARAGAEQTRAAALNELTAIGYPLRRNPKLIEAARSAKMQEIVEKGVEDPAVMYNAIAYAHALLSDLDPKKYPAGSDQEFMARFKDREAAQLAAEKAAEEARILKERGVRMIDNDPRKRWILHPALGREQPPKGWGLLVVMPGGDGWIGFADFVADTIRPGAGEDCIVVQMVAPPMKEGVDGVVWPREGLKDQRVDFTMEPLWRGAIAQVKKERVIDPERVWVMGWSSGGPPSYLAALEDDSAVRGAFVAMSVFRPEEYPTIANAKGKAFYILHSPQDWIEMAYPEKAKETLERAGARVRLQTYQGGHGWQGDSMKRIGEAMKWLEGKE